MAIAKANLLDCFKILGIICLKTLWSIWKCLDNFWTSVDKLSKRDGRNLSRKALKLWGHQKQIKSISSTSQVDAPRKKCRQGIKLVCILNIGHFSAIIGSILEQTIWQRCIHQQSFARLSRYPITQSGYFCFINFAQVSSTKSRAARTVYISRTFGLFSIILWLFLNNKNPSPRGAFLVRMCGICYDNEDKVIIHVQRSLMPKSSEVHNFYFVTWCNDFTNSIS